MPYFKTLAGREQLNSDLNKGPTPVLIIVLNMGHTTAAYEAPIQGGAYIPTLRSNRSLRGR